MKIKLIKINKYTKFITLVIFSVAFFIFFASNSLAATISITANPSMVSPGGNSTISWTSDFNNSQSSGCTLYRDGSLTGTSVGIQGSQAVSNITESTTFSIMCLVNSGALSGPATVSDNIDINVTGMPFPSKGFGINANPLSVAPGGTSTLYWRGGGYCTINNNTVSSPEFTTPPLTTKTAFTLTCSYPGFGGPGYSMSKTILINIIGAPTVSITAKPTTIGAGGFTTVTWSSTGATSCTSNVNEIKGLSGSIDLSPPYSMFYNITCMKDGVSTTASAPVYVNPWISAGITNVFTGNAKDIKDTSATLTGSLIPGGEDAFAYFRYSTIEGFPPVFCNDIYGSKMKSTKEIKIAGGSGSTIFNYELTGLEPGKKYYYCAIGSNSKQINSGGAVKYFTTKLPTGSFSIETKEAVVASETSAYLNGFFNTSVSANTYFEYRKSGLDSSSNKQSSFFERIKNKLANFFKTNKVEAATSILKKKPTTFDWIKVGEKSQSANRNGSISYLLTGLSPSTMYDFRAVIKADSDTYVISDTVYGNISSFKTKEGSSTSSGEVPGGGAYIDPCTNTDDVNCNGTGGGSNITFGGGNGLPDLTVSYISPTNIIVNTTTALTATIKNLGDTSTGKKFYGFFQISTVYRGPVNESNPNGGAVPTGNTVSKFFKTNKAFAANTSTGGVVVDNTLFNLPGISIPELAGKSSTQIENNYKFVSKGNYYVRACADKNSIMDAGLIKELYENNNCGPWTKITVGDANSWNNDFENNWNNNSNNNSNNNTTNNNDYQNLTLGQKATPPVDAIVRYHEGIEHVFVRQIKNNTDLRESYGYKEGMNLDAFAWDLADLLARTFGYVNSSGKEIRVSKPDIAAYQLYMNNGILTVYEYYDGVIVNIQKMTEFLRNKYDYEYYFKK